MYAGLRFAVTLLVFFYSSSLLTKYRGDMKQKVDAEYKEGGSSVAIICCSNSYVAGGQRDAVQVLCNGLWGTLAAAACTFDLPIDSKQINFRPPPPFQDVVLFGSSTLPLDF